MGRYRAWWACHWCDWEAPVRQRLFDRRRATSEFKRHLRENHPEHTDYAPWKEGGSW